MELWLRWRNAAISALLTPWVISPMTSVSRAVRCCSSPGQTTRTGSAPSGSGGGDTTLEDVTTASNAATSSEPVSDLPRNPSNPLRSAASTHAARVSQL